MLLNSPLGKKMSWALMVLPGVAMVLIILTTFLALDWREKQRQLSDTVVPLVTDLNSVYRIASSHRYTQDANARSQAPRSVEAVEATSKFNNQLLDVIERRLGDNNNSASLGSLWSELKSLWTEYTKDIALEGTTVSDTSSALTNPIPTANLTAYELFLDKLQSQQHNTEAELAATLALQSKSVGWLVLTLALLMIDIIIFAYLVWHAFKSIGQELGATPDKLHSIASQLASGSSAIESSVYCDSNNGLLASLCQISLKLEEINTEAILARQFEREKESRSTEDDAAIVSLDTERDKETQESCPKTQDDCVKALELQKQITSEYERRIGALLETAKSVASGDLTKRSNVTGEDDVGRIAHWQRKIIDNIARNLQQFDTQAQMLKGSSTQLNTLNSKMRHSSVQTAEQAKLASSSAEDISKTVDNVALAVKEMSASIREISEHSSEAAQVAEQAVTLAKDTDTTVRQLGDSSTSIGAVIKVINSIAEQTNLLALNATIEAARAGEAGKGFAVVANEVKELAKETAKATEEIAQQISTIQSDSNDAVSAISDIGNIIDRVNEIQTTIAAAVEEQSVTASEINRSIGDVSKGSSEIAKNVSLVADTAHESIECVEGTQSAVDQMICISSDLDELVASYRLASPNASSKAA